MMMMLLRVGGCVTLLLAASVVSVHGAADHRYKKGDHVDLWVNKVRAYQKYVCVG